MDSVTPARVLQVVGGIGMVVASFLEWASADFALSGADDEIIRATATSNGWDFGMLGLWQTIFGAIIAIAGLIGMSSAADRLPKELLGFDFEQALVVLAVPVVLWNFGLQFDDVAGGLGLFIGWIAAALTIAGSELQRRTFNTAALA